MTQDEVLQTLREVIAEAENFTTWTVSTPHLVELVKRAVEVEREALMQLFTDPENQPTQHGTVTLEYMQREVAAEREACANVCDDIATEDGFEGGYANGCAEAIRARGNT